MKHSVTTVTIICLLAVLGVLAFSGWPPFSLDTDRASSAPAPCAEPITYRIGTVDSRFDISDASVERIVGEAVGFWEEAIPNQLFVKDPDGDLVINLTFDDRQITWENQAQARRAIDRAHEEHEQLAAQHRVMVRRFEERETAYRGASEQLDQLIEQHNERVRKWNAGVAPPTDEERDRIQEERAEIERMQHELDEEARELTAMQDRVNEIADRVNDSARTAREKVDDYNRQFGNLDGFNKGEFIRRAGQKTINIYQFDGENDLTVVLVHELGHALGIDHIDDPGAIMYYEVSEENSHLTTLSDADRAALNELCRVGGPPASD